MPDNDDFTITPTSVGREIAVSSRSYGRVLADSMNEAIQHSLANHDDSCDYCRTRRERRLAAELEFKASLEAARALAISYPTPEHLDAYADHRIEARERGYE